MIIPPSLGRFDSIMEANAANDIERLKQAVEANLEVVSTICCNAEKTIRQYRPIMQDLSYVLYQINNGGEQNVQTYADKIFAIINRNTDAN